MEIVRPESVGLSSERLARIEEHLERRYLAPRKIAGALTLVARRGRIAHLKAVGSADLERGVPLRDDTIFRIYSMTKPITSVALMTLYERGAFQLEDPVHRFIPAWRDLRVFDGGNHPAFATRPCERAMSVRDLFTHMSGLTYGFMERTNVDRAYRRLGIGEVGDFYQPVATHTGGAAAENHADRSALLQSGQFAWVGLGAAPAMRKSDHGFRRHHHLATTTQAFGDVIGDAKPHPGIFRVGLGTHWQNHTGRDQRARVCGLNLSPISPEPQQSD